MPIHVRQHTIARHVRGLSRVPTELINHCEYSQLDRHIQ